MKDIELKKICKSYGERTVIGNLSVTFPAGSRTAIMGPSGVGKTTLIGMIMGTVKPDGGRLLGCDGVRMSCIFQEDRLFESFGAVENITAATGCDEKTVKNELHEVGLDIEGDKPVSAMSGGEKRRVAIVRAMIDDSEVVIADEPFKGLDEELKEQVMEYVDSRIGCRTFILVTHDIDEAARLECGVLEIKA